MCIVVQVSESLSPWKFFIFIILSIRMYGMVWSSIDRIVNISGLKFSPFPVTNNVIGLHGRYIHRHPYPQTRQMYFLFNILSILKLLYADYWDILTKHIDI